MEAQQRASTLASMLGRSDVAVRQSARGAAVLLGSYPSSDDAQAQSDLKYVRGLSIRGTTPFARAYFVPPEVKADEGSNPKQSLAGLRRERGPGKLYTLQIAVYESDDMNEARRAAEQAVTQLRNEGEAAYYHHGPNRSMVTVGVFTAQEFDPADGVYPPRLTELQRKYPNNLVNGRTATAGGGRTVPSVLVEVPE